MPEERRISRLVARYSLEPPLLIEWDASTPKKRGRKLVRTKKTRAEIRDISLTGALVSVETTKSPKAGSTVEIRRHERAGTVRVRYNQPGDEPDTILVGVEFLDVADAFPDLTEIIGDQRDAGRRLEQIWERAT